MFQKAIRNLGWCRHLVLMHLMATNIAVWLRLLVWETARSWLDVTHTSLNASERFPPEGYNTTAHALFSDGRHEVYGIALFLLFNPILKLHCV